MCMCAPPCLHVHHRLQVPQRPEEEARVPDLKAQGL